MTDSWIDLHVHTYCSDGLRSPSDMVRWARKVGLSAVGICDHDTIAGLKEGQSTGRLNGIEVVPGMELSSQYKGRDLHILGYYFDPENADLNDYLQRFRTERYRRAAKMIVNLNQDGIHIDMDDIEKKAEGSSIGRPHIAEALMERGYVETFQEAFHRYIGYGAASYVEKYKLPPDQAIQLIAQSRGISILAHPGPVVSDDILVDLIKMGIDGMEVIHPNLNQRRTRYLMGLAKEHGLLVSGGSDCHGGRTGNICMGKYNVPYSFLEAIKDKKARMDEK